jgi:hypothetical protein
MKVVGSNAAASIGRSKNIRGEVGVASDANRLVPDAELRHRTGRSMPFEGAMTSSPTPKPR